MNLFKHNYLKLPTVVSLSRLNTHLEIVEKYFMNILTTTPDIFKLFVPWGYFLR